MSLEKPPTVAGWAAAGVIASPGAGRISTGMVPGEILPAGFFNLTTAWAGLLDSLTVQDTSPDDVGFSAAGYALRVQGGSAGDIADLRGGISTGADRLLFSVLGTGGMLGLDLVVGNPATQDVRFGGPLNAAQSSGQAIAPGGVTYGYGAGGSVCRYGLTGGLALARAATGRTAGGVSIASGGAVFFEVPTGPLRGPGAGTTPASFYVLGPDIDVYVDVSGSSVDIDVSLIATSPFGGAPAVVATAAITSIPTGTSTLTLAIPLADRPIGGGAQYVVEVAVVGGGGTAQIQTCAFEITKRGVE
jgi:hypothetical protein